MKRILFSLWIFSIVVALGAGFFVIVFARELYIENHHPSKPSPKISPQIIATSTVNQSSTSKVEDFTGSVKSNLKETEQSAVNSTNATLQTSTPEVSKSIANQPSPTATATQNTNTAQIFIDQIGSFDVIISQSDTVLSALLRAGTENGFKVEVVNYGSMGSYIKCIGNLCETNQKYWAYYIDGRYASLGASSQNIEPKDKIEWRYQNK